MARSTAGAALLLGVALLLSVLGPSPVLGSRSLLQPGAALYLTTPPDQVVGLGFKDAASVAVGFKTSFIFIVINFGNAPVTAPVSLSINNLFTFSNVDAPAPAFNVTISPDGHSATALSIAPAVPNQPIEFRIDVTATAVGNSGPRPFGLTASVPGGVPFQAPTPAVTPAITTSAPTSTPTPAPTPRILVPPSTQCPPVNGVYTNSCFNSHGTMQVCCINPGACGPVTADGNPTCTNGQYYIFN